MRAVGFVVLAVLALRANAAAVGIPALDVVEAPGARSTAAVQSALLLSLSTTQATLLGIDQRPVDGTVFSFKKSGSAGFLVGAPCNGASNCVDIPGAVTSLMGDLQKLDAQQRQDPSCTAFLGKM